MDAIQLWYPYFMRKIMYIQDTQNVGPWVGKTFLYRTKLMYSTLGAIL